MANNVSASAAFTGFDNNWNFGYTTGKAGIFVQAITIDLSPTDSRFDTAAGGFGSLGFQDVGGYGGTDLTTGLTSVSGTGLAWTAVACSRSRADLDHPNPTLQTLAICSGTALQKAICNAGNAAKTASNGVLLLAADTVLSAQMSNALVTFQSVVRVTSPHPPQRRQSLA